MKKPLLLSFSLASLLVTHLNAESLYERFKLMELEMQEMQKELAELKSANKSEAVISKTEVPREPLPTKEELNIEEDEEAIELEETLSDMQESITELNKATSGSHLKFGVDYRFSLENMEYEMADGSTQSNDAFMANRLWIDMDWRATKRLSFQGQLAYTKAFGARSGADTSASYEAFDWITNENAYDDILRVRSAYFLYANETFLGTDIPWTFSVGRRPSTNGHLINLRDDDGASSPMGHTINVEFDGLSSKFVLENITGVNGSYMKFCAGRAMSNAAPKFSSAPYASKDTNPNIDLAGVIFVPWSNGQYGVASQYYYANNLIDASDPMNQAAGFDTVGGMHSFTANFTANGIGSEWSEYLDDTTFFLSGALNHTNPNSDKGMLGSEIGESVTGYSLWLGLQMPSLISDDGRWGLEYNKGSRYWRSITYAEDTNIGSKLATRGDAYEAYFTEPLIDDILTLQIRYTYLDYKYAGSNGFFGNTTGDSVEISDTMPMAANYVKRAQDIRFYLRYRY